MTEVEMVGWHHQLCGHGFGWTPGVGDATQPSRPLSLLLLLPSIFPSTRVFSNESVLLIRWPMELQLWHQSFH